MAAIGAAAAERFARQALAAVGDAQRAVDEHFQRHVGARRDLADVVDRQFAGQNHALDAQPADEFDAARLGQRHLRRAVDRQLGSQPVHQPRQTQVLHDHGIGARRGDRPRQAAPLRPIRRRKISVLSAT